MIDGPVPRKSNSRQIVKAGGRLRVIKSKAALEFMKRAKNVPDDLRRELGSVDHPLFVRGVIYYPWKTRGDLSGEMVLDFLTGAKVISDDRYVVRQEWIKKYDREAPRAEVLVEELDNWEW